MLDSDNIKDYYKALDKHSLLELARNPKGVRPELVSVLIGTLKERNIGLEYIESILLETNYFLDNERETLIQSIKESECTKCNISRNLNGYSFRTITSYIIHKHESYEKQIICSNCAIKKELKSFCITLLFGWWSKRGFLWTPITLFCKIGNIFIRKSISKDIIKDFIDNNTLHLRKFGTSDKSLNTILKEYNGYTEEYEN
jgi:hypothetical protein